MKEMNIMERVDWSREELYVTNGYSLWLLGTVKRKSWCDSKASTVQFRRTWETQVRVCDIQHRLLKNFSIVVHVYPHTSTCSPKWNVIVPSGLGSHADRADSLEVHSAISN